MNIISISSNYPLQWNSEQYALYRLIVPNLLLECLNQLRVTILIVQCMHSVKSELE